MSRLARVVALLPLVALLAVPAAAQERQGLMFGVGFGYGNFGFNCDGCDSDREGGYSGNLRIGYSVNPRLVVGVDTEGWFKDSGTGYIWAGTITASVAYYPLPTQPLFVRGGAGLGLIRIGVDGIGSDGESGFGWSLGAGYDIPVTPTAALTPYFNYMSGDLEDGSYDIWQVGLGITAF